MKEILIDLLVFWLSVLVAWAGFLIHAPVLVLIGVIFMVTSICWMFMDFKAGIKK